MRDLLHSTHRLHMSKKAPFIETEEAYAKLYLPLSYACKSFAERGVAAL